MSKKYISIEKLGTFLENLRNTFADLAHTHKLEDITDYTVDDALSDTSVNPVQNRVLKAEFDEVRDVLVQKTQVQIITLEEDE